MLTRIMHTRWDYDPTLRTHINLARFLVIVLPRLLIYYLVFINLVSFFMMFLDKRKAVKGRYRISEKALLLSGAAGGVVGMLLGMKYFRHKTRKGSFKLPTVGVVLLNLVYWYLMYVYLW